MVCRPFISIRNLTRAQNSATTELQDQIFIGSHAPAAKQITQQQFVVVIFLSLFNENCIPLIQKNRKKKKKKSNDIWNTSVELVVTKSTYIALSIQVSSYSVSSSGVKGDALLLETQNVPEKYIFYVQPPVQLII